jgi:hypothetical protein
MIEGFVVSTRSKMLSCRVGSATAWLRQFSSSASTSQECWGEFKEILSQAIATNIPTKCLHQDGMYLGSLEKLKH